MTWAYRAPNLAGLPGWTKADLVKLLTTGRSPSGTKPRAPMPPFKMSIEDASAVASYLKAVGQKVTTSASPELKVVKKKPTPPPAPVVCDPCVCECPAVAAPGQTAEPAVAQPTAEPAVAPCVAGQDCPAPPPGTVGPPALVSPTQTATTTATH